MTKKAQLLGQILQKKTIYLLFSGHELIDGFDHVLSVLDNQNIKGSFFFTGDFVRNNQDLVQQIAKKGHFVGAHSDKHLLYCDWTKRDSLLVSEEQIKEDILQNIKALNKLAIYPNYFMAPYEWHNLKVVEIAKELNQITVNFSSGTRSNGDYTTPDMTNYLSSKVIFDSIIHYESMNNMNGFHLLTHPGTSPLRKDKFYLQLEEVITFLKKKGYQFSKF